MVVKELKNFDEIVKALISGETIIRSTWNERSEWLLKDGKIVDFDGNPITFLVKVK